MSSTDTFDHADSSAAGGPRLLILWSPPRCRSTAFLRMMAARGDMQVVHEPFSHLMDFGAADVGGTRCTDEQSVMAALLELAHRGRVFVKDTTDFHYPEMIAATEFLRSATHSVIIRHPLEAIASHFRLNPQLTCEEIGFTRVREIFDAAAAVGTTPVVIDSDDLVDHPEATVRAYCTRVGIPFRANALEWEAEAASGWGQASRWHTDAAQSTGFGRPGRDSDGTVEKVDVQTHPQLGEFYRHHLPHYEWLRERKLPLPSN